MKSYTDIPQSKKLAEILSLESADMCYIKHASSNNPDWRFDNDIPPMILGNVPINEITAETLPCWSLAALLDILAKETHNIDEDGHVVLSSYKGNWWNVSPINCINGEIKESNNPLDAVFEMVVLLKENGKI